MAEVVLADRPSRSLPATSEQSISGRRTTSAPSLTVTVVSWRTSIGCALLAKDSTSKVAVAPPASNVKVVVTSAVEKSYRCSRKVKATEEIAEHGSAVQTTAALFQACVPVIPYAPAIAFLAGERSRLDRAEGRPRVAIVVDAIGAPHGVSHTIKRIRELAVPGFDVEVVGTDRQVDRRLPAVAEVAMPYYEGMEVGIPSLPSLIETLADGEYDLIHVATPGPAGVAAALTARVAGSRWSRATTPSSWTTPGCVRATRVWRPRWAWR